MHENWVYDSAIVIAYLTRFRIPQRYNASEITSSHLDVVSEISAQPETLREHPLTWNGLTGSIDEVF